MCDDEWDEVPWLENEGFVQTLVDKVDFLDILDKYGLEYHRAGSSHKLLCPLPRHTERTPSFTVTGPFFKCFGCGAGGSVIDFVMIYKGCVRYRAIEDIAKIAGFTEDDIDDDFVPVKYNPEHTVLPYVFNAGVVIREHLASVKNSKDYYKWDQRAKKWFDRLDHYMNNLEDEQWETAKDYSLKIKCFIEKSGDK